MSITFNNRVAIITGAGGGLGSTYALEIAKRGGAVVVNDLGGAYNGQGESHSMADTIVAQIKAAGGRAVANYDSVGTRAGGEAIVKTAMENFGRVDIVINNAGHLRNALFEDIDDAILDSLIDVHLKGAFYVTQPAYKIMKKQGYGRVVFASSAAGMLGNPAQAAYAAAKSGLIGMMNVLSIEGVQHGVLCNALLPTATSRMIAAMPLQYMKEIEEQFAAIAPLVGNALDPHFITPMMVYLASEKCQSTHAIYSASLGRYARAFIGVGDGWCSGREVAPSVDDIDAHWDQIISRDSFCVPSSLDDEFSEVVKLLSK